MYIYAILHGVMLKTFIEIAHNNGKNMMLYMGPYIFLLTSDPAVIKDVTASKQCIDKPAPVYDGFSNALSRGLITLQGDHWSRDRKIMNPAFKVKNILTFIPIFNRKANALIECIDEDIESGRKTLLLHFLREMTLNISSETIIGRQFDETEHDIKLYSQRCTLAMEYICELSTNFIYLNGFVRDIAKKTIFKESSEMIDILHSVIVEVSKLKHVHILRN
uniref:Cytochrome P450 n=1 Tax=Stomoxys calcitrans TaxID=35570 RepID=A0A1I8PQR3_STOCA